MGNSHPVDPSVVRRIATRYIRMASFTPPSWQDVVNWADRFNQLHQIIQSWGKLRKAQLVYDALVSTRNYGQVISELKTMPDQSLRDWFHGNNLTKELNSLVKYRKKIQDAATLVRLGVDSVNEGFTERLRETAIALGSLWKNMDEYAKVASLVGTAAPATFKYGGFVVQNPTRLSDKSVREMLTGIDFIAHIFKQRGITPILKESVKTIRLVMGYVNGVSTHGLYHPTQREIWIGSYALKTGSGRLIKDWMEEVFLHELAHHIHLSILPSAAKSYWDSGWDPVEEAKEESATRLHDMLSVTQKDRQAFWDTLVKVNGDLRKVPYKGVKRMKFHAWLKEPLMGGPYVTPKQLRWTNNARSLVDFLKDPEGHFRERGYSEASLQDNIRDMLKTYQETLGVDFGAVHPKLDISDPLVKKYHKEDRAVEKAIDSLAVPTWYARTNKMEDFAESFVAFVANPSTLSDKATFRMKRTLSLSGLYGKPIMRLSRINKIIP